MYWTELGQSSQIKRALLDGTEVQLLIGVLFEPNGLAIDIGDQRLYWCDTFFGTITSADMSGGVPTDIQYLELSDVSFSQPFAITLSETSVFWTDIDTNSVYSTHKQHGTGDGGHFFTVFSAGTATPRGVEVVSSSQQPTRGEKTS